MAHMPSLCQSLFMHCSQDGTFGINNMPRERKMIESLDDLIRYSEHVAIALPLIADRVRIVRPGCQPDVLAVLKQVLPGLPESYLSVVRSIAIDAIAIGY